MNWSALRRRMSARCVLYGAALVACVVVPVPWLEAAPYAALVSLIVTTLYASEASRWFHEAERQAIRADMWQEMFETERVERAEAQMRREAAEDPRRPF